MACACLPGGRNVTGSLMLGIMAFIHCGQALILLRDRGGTLGGHPPRWPEGPVAGVLLAVNLSMVMDGCAPALW